MKNMISAIVYMGYEQATFQYQERSYAKHAHIRISRT